MYSDPQSLGSQYPTLTTIERNESERQRKEGGERKKGRKREKEERKKEREKIVDT